MPRDQMRKTGQLLRLMIIAVVLASIWDGGLGSQGKFSITFDGGGMLRRINLPRLAKLPATARC